MTRIGFAPHLYGAGWLGGISYLRNLFSALARLENRKLEPVLLVRHSDRQAAAELSKLVAVRDVPRHLDTHSGRTGRGIAAMPPLSWALWRRYLAAEGIAGLSHSPALLPARMLPSLAIIYDFQHKHLPHLFSTVDRSLRDRSFRSLCRSSSVVLVSSECALSDLKRFFPRYADKGRVLRFVANLDGTALTPPDILSAKYRLPASYFYLPNQFWKHKNHVTVIRALAILKRKRSPVAVIASGAEADYRHPQHFSDLMDIARTLGVEDSFHVLGVVPYADLLGLMRHCTAVMNPSLFEGWSTTVEEAKSMGKLVILSNIPVHLEQRPERSLFFEATSPEELADRMATAIDLHSTSEELQHLAKAHEEMGVRVRRYAQAYHDIALPVLAGHGAAA